MNLSLSQIGSVSLLTLPVALLRHVRSTCSQIDCVGGEIKDWYYNKITTGYVHYSYTFSRSRGDVFARSYSGCANSLVRRSRTPASPPSTIRRRSASARASASAAAAAAYDVDDEVPDRDEHLVSSEEKEELASLTREAYSETRGM